MKPYLGQVVLYTLTDADVERIAATRADYQIEGNHPASGDTYPLIVTRVHEVPGPDWPVMVNGQVLLDGEDVLWVTSVRTEPLYPATGYIQPVESYSAGITAPIPYSGPYSPPGITGNVCMNPGIGSS